MCRFRFGWTPPGSRIRRVGIVDKAVHLFMQKLVIRYTLPLHSREGGGVGTSVHNALKICEARSVGASCGICSLMY